LLKQGFNVRIFDKLYGSNHLVRDIEKELDIREGDIERPADVLKALEGMNVAVNLIHTTVTGSSMQAPQYDVQSNIVSAVKWLPLMQKAGLSRIIYISSGGTVYGIPRDNPIHENHPIEPICSYGITKLAIEKYVAMYSHIHGIQYRICRPSNIYGEGQRLNTGEGVIWVFLDRALSGQAIEIWGDGTNKRDFLYVDDLVSGIIGLIGHAGRERVFNLSSGAAHSLNDIISIMKNDLKILVAVRYKPSRGFDVPVNILDNTRLRNETGWAPKTSLREGVQRVYQWLQTNRS
jgi:UDP-glucose 4-epimerase